MEDQETTPLLRNETLASTAIDEAQPKDQDTQKSLPNGKSVASIISILLIGVFVSQADVCLVLATYGQISSEFHALEQGGWLLTSYMLAQCAAQPLYGKLSDIFGRKRCLQTAYILFATGTLCSGLATSMPQIIASRALEGCGGAGMVCMVSILLTDLVPLEKVAVYRSYVNLVQTAGRSCGGVIGGYMAQTVGWRWPFLIQCPLVLTGILLTEFKLATPSQDKVVPTNLRQKLNRIDFSGAFLMSMTILGSLAVMDLGGQKLPWSHPIIIITIITTVVCGIAFTLVEKYRAAEPIFPLRLLTHYVVFTSYIMLALQNLAVMAMMFVVPMYFQVFKLSSAGEAGSYLIPSTVGNTIGGLLTGMWIGRTRHYKMPIIIGAFSSMAGFIGLILFWRGRTGILEALLILPVGLATGIAHSAIFIGMSAGVDNDDIAIAGSGLYLSGNVGMVAGVSIGNVVYQMTLQKSLPSALHQFPNRDTIIKKALTDIAYVQSLTGGLREAILPAYLLSFQNVFVAGLIASVLCLVVGIFSRERMLPTGK